MTEKVHVSKIELCGDRDRCRVILSDGKELDGLQRIAPGEATPSNLLTVQIDAILWPSGEDDVSA